MRRITITVALIFVAIALNAQAAETAVSSRITSVTVYPDRALVTREAVVNLAPGVQKLVVKDLPGGIEDESVRGWGKGVAKVKLLGLNISRVDLSEAAEEEIRKLQERLDAISGDIEAVKQENSIIEVEKNYLSALVSSFNLAFNRGVLSGESTAARLSGVEGIVSRRLSALAERSMELAARLRQLEKDRAAVQEKMDQLAHPGQTQKKTLTIDIECMSGGSFTLGFSYIMSNAGWSPVYDIRADSDTGNIEIASKANVWQQVGEDWNQVELTLSTATPQVGGEMPTPTPLVLDFAQVYPVERRKMMALGAAAPPPPPAEAPAPMIPAQAAVISGETAVEFKVQKLRTVVSNGKPNLVPISSDSFDGKLSYVSIPSESAFAYLQAKVKNTSGRAFLPGDAAIFLAGRYVGKARLPRWAPGEEVEMPLGIDEGIGIKRELVSKKTDNSLGKTTINYEWKIEVQNNLRSELKLKLFEPIPQSRHDDIDVKVISAAPQPNEIEEGGKARWDITLAPGTKQTITLSYRIKYPEGRTVENLP